MVFPIRDKPLSRRGNGRSLRRPTAWAVRYGAVLSRLLVGLTLLLHGCERREIVRPTPQMDLESRFWVRVLMLADASECTIEIPSAFQIVPTGREPGLSAGRPAAEPLRAATRVRVTNGRLVLGATTLADAEVVISPEQPHVFRLNGQGYRGKLKLTVDRAEQTFEAVNLVPLEPYLAGVVGAEMPDYWEPQALQAQAIAARTYCLYIKDRFGANRRYDVSRTQASQVYSGIGAESAQVWNAVNSTYGKVLVVAGSKSPARVGGNLLDRGLFPTYYSSMCGGHTADSEAVFGDSFFQLCDQTGTMNKVRPAWGFVYLCLKNGDIHSLNFLSKHVRFAR